MQSFEAFVASRYTRFAEALKSSDKAPLADVLEVFDRVIAKGGTVWVAGNGCSAAITDIVAHITVDNYGIIEDTHQRPIHILTKYMKAPNQAALAL